jgi:hypothetical protein
VDEVLVHLDGVIGVVGWSSGTGSEGVGCSVRGFGHALSMIGAEGI